MKKSNRWVHPNPATAGIAFKRNQPLVIARLLEVQTTSQPLS